MGQREKIKRKEKENGRQQKDKKENKKKRRYWKEWRIKTEKIIEEVAI